MLTYQREGGIGLITLANPPWNAFAAPVFAEHGELEAFLAASDLRAVLLRGEGRHFSSGADLDALTADRRDPDALKSPMERGKRLLEMLAYAPVPVLAAVRGSCLGAGFEIALACHFRFASDHAMFGFPEVEHGLVPGFGGTVRAPFLAPRAAVIDLVLSGRMIGAAEALGLGLVDRVLPTDQVEAEGVRFLRSLTDSRPPEVIHAVMTSIHNGRRLPLDEALRRETELFFSLVRRNG